MAEFKYQVTKVIGTLSETGNGWSKELNLVSWNGKPADARTRRTRPRRAGAQTGNMPNATHSPWLSSANSGVHSIP